MIWRKYADLIAQLLVSTLIAGSCMSEPCSSLSQQRYLEWYQLLSDWLLALQWQNLLSVSEKLAYYQYTVFRSI